MTKLYYQNLKDYFYQKTVLNAGFRDFWSDPDLLWLIQLVALNAENSPQHNTNV